MPAPAAEVQPRLAAGSAGCAVAGARVPKRWADGARVTADGWRGAALAIGYAAVEWDGFDELAWEEEKDVFELPKIETDISNCFYQCKTTLLSDRGHLRPQ